MKNKAKIIFCTAALSVFSFVSCSSSKNYTLPSKDQYEGYEIIDSVERDTIFTRVETSDRIAVVLKDIATTSYSFLEPRYNNSMVHFDGKSKCCTSDSPIMGNSGLVVYKFSFIGKGTTAINIVARQKGLSTTAGSFETDHLYTINVEVK